MNGGRFHESDDLEDGEKHQDVTICTIWSRKFGAMKQSKFWLGVNFVDAR